MFGTDLVHGGTRKGVVRLQYKKSWEEEGKGEEREGGGEREGRGLNLGDLSASGEEEEEEEEGGRGGGVLVVARKEGEREGGGRVSYGNRKASNGLMSKTDWEREGREGRREREREGESWLLKERVEALEEWVSTLGPRPYTLHPRPEALHSAP
eukprot:1373268-Rhodomonas_salina.1